MRMAFSRALVAAARQDPQVLLLTGDHGYALFDDFRSRCADQFINAGVAEQNMVGVAAGLAKGGFRPVVYGLSAFMPMRVLEQIKLDVCYENLPVAFVGDGAGVVHGQLGSSHQCTEDIAALRALPAMSVLSPCDAHEMAACMAWALEADGPVYVRMGKADLGHVHEKDPVLYTGRPLRLRAGAGPLAWLATGSMVQTALEASRAWAGSSVWSAPFIKPLNEEVMAGICQGHHAVIVLEEHNVLGGLGSAIAEIAAARAPTWICRVGIQDRFSEYCGTYGYLMKEHRLTIPHVVEQVRRFLQQIAVNGLGPRGSALAA